MKSLIMGLLVLLLQLPTASATQYSIDETQSTIKFSIHNMGVKVDGTLPAPTGTVFFDPNDLAASHFEVDVDVKGIDTGMDKRDEHLRTADYFDVAQYPTIHFTSTSITHTGKGYIAYGKLRIKDVEKQVGIRFTVAQVDTIGSFQGSLTIKRLDYGIGGKTKLLGDDVTINITVVVTK